MKNNNHYPLCIIHSSCEKMKFFSSYEHKCLFMFLLLAFISYALASPNATSSSSASNTRKPGLSRDLKARTSILRGNVYDETDEFLEDEEDNQEVEQNKNVFDYHDPAFQAEVARVEVCVKMCTEEYRPVCASDGTSYLNLCYFNNAKCIDDALVIVKDGKCYMDVPTIPTLQVTNQPDCSQKLSQCTDDYAPVCGSDDVTYDNICLFQYSKCRNPVLYVASLGECLPLKDIEYVSYCTNPCADVFEPVCGNDAITYRNKCQLENVACIDTMLQLLHEGMCYDEWDEEKLSDEQHLVDQKDSKWVDLANEHSTDTTPVISPAPTVTSPQKNCDFKCPAIWKPVCTKDLMVFANKCELIAAQCLDPSIEFFKDGECEGPHAKQPHWM